MEAHAVKVPQRREVDMVDAKARWDRGDSARAIARELGVSYNTVTNWVRRHGWTPRGTMVSRDRDATLRNRLAERVADGQSLPEAVRGMGLAVAFGDVLWGQICRGLGEQAQ